MNRRGFFSIDGVAGLLIMAALLVALGMVAGKRNRAVARLAETRAAMRLADKTLLDLQLGLKIAPPAGVEVTAIPETEGVSWVRIDVVTNGRTFSLIGPTGRTP